MNYAVTFRMAKEMDINKLAAARMRCRYLSEQISECLDDGSEIALFWATEMLEEKIWLLSRAYHEEVPCQTNGITDEMIDRARKHPVELLVNFSKGKARAWCHDDRNPSLGHNKKHNRVKCWVCNKSWDAIGILMERDGYTFQDAVKQLS